jgi:hypothetical protein
MEKVQVRFGDWIEKGFNLYKNNFGILVLSSLVALVISTATLGILAGPMIAGMIIITLALHDEKDPRPEVGTVFKGFDYFLQSLLFFVVWGCAVLVVSFLLGLVPCIGALAALFAVYAAQTFLMFGIFLIVERRLEFWAASQESFNVVKTNFWLFLGFTIVAGLIGSIGAIACGIGVAITVPIQICILTVAYREVFASHAAEQAVEVETRNVSPDQGSNPGT